MSKIGALRKECTNCKCFLSYIYAIYKLNYYCINCYTEEVEKRKQLIATLPDIEPRDPPLGWLHKFQEEDVTDFFKSLKYQQYRES